MKKILIFYLLFVFSSSNAENIGSDTGLELPRFVSLKSNDSNLRIGPSKNYPIKIKYVVKNFPLQVIEEHNEWRKVVDFQNNDGWIHKSLLKGLRTGIIISEDKKEINVLNTLDGKIMGVVTIGSIIYLSKCKLNWCLIKDDNYKGWINKKYIWGSNKNEVYNIGIFQIFIDYYFESINMLERYLY